MFKIGEEYIETKKCVNRVAAKNIYSGFNYPLGNNAAFDGYAVRSSDTTKLTKKCMKLTPKCTKIGAIFGAEN